MSTPVYWTKERAAGKRIGKDPDTGKFNIPTGPRSVQPFAKNTGTPEEVYSGVAFKTHNWVTRGELYKNSKTGEIGYVNIRNENRSRSKSSTK